MRGLEGPRANQRAYARGVEHTRGSGGPRACHRTHVRGEERRQLARSERFRMQFDWVDFQRCLLALRFLRYGCVVGRGVGGIACDIRG